MKEKNLIIAIGLSLVVMIGWSLLVEKKLVPGAPSTSAGNDAIGSVRKENDARSSTPAAGSKGPAAASSPKVEREPTSPEASSSAKAPEPAMVRTTNAEVQLSTHRASITSYRYHGPLGWIELTLAPGLLQTDGAGVFTANAASGPGVVFEGT